MASAAVFYPEALVKEQKQFHGESCLEKQAARQI